MSAKHTPGPWMKGFMLDTPTTLSWSHEERVRGQEQESLRVFSHFSALNQGRSRELIAVVRERRNVPLIAAAPELLDALVWHFGAEESCERCANQGGRCLAHAAIAKAEGRS